MMKKRKEQEAIQDWNKTDQWIQFYNSVSWIMPKATSKQNEIKEILPF
jgi:hypothetical protein